LRGNLGSAPNFPRNGDVSDPIPIRNGDVSDPVPAWRSPVIGTSMVGHRGIDALVAAIDGHQSALAQSGEIETRRALIAERRLLKAGEEILRDEFARHRDGKVSALLEQVKSRAVSPHTAAVRLLRELHIGEEP